MLYYGVKGGIYGIRCEANGTTYVGQSQNVRNRFCQHRCKLRRGQHANPYLQAAWLKYGEEVFNFEALLWEDDPHKRDLAEESIFQRLRTGQTSLFNLRPATSTNKGTVLSEGTKAKIRAKAQSQFSSPEARARHSQSYRKGGGAFVLISPERVEHRFYNPAEFARSNNLNPGRVHKLLKGRTYSHKGWIYPLTDQSKKKTCRLSLEQKDQARNLYQSGKTSTEIAMIFGVSRSSILGWLKRQGIRGGKKKRIENHSQRAKDLYEAGLTTTEIAKGFGVNPSTVQRWVKQRGITLPIGRRPCSTTTRCTL